MPVKPVMQLVQTDVDEQVSQPVICDEQRVQAAPPLGLGTYLLIHPQEEGAAAESVLKLVALQDKQSVLALL